MDKPKPQIRVLIADDHPMVIAGIRTFLADHTHIEIAGEASHGNEAIEKARALQPDIILMDISMPVMNGLEATRKLLDELPLTDVIILTMHDDKEYIRQIVNSGAKGYILKNAAQEDILKAIEAVYNGGAFFSPEVSRVILEEARAKDNLLTQAPLTEQEREILILIAEDNSNKQIADKLNITQRSVEKQRTRIMQKLDIHSIVGLTRYAIAQGLVKP